MNITPKALKKLQEYAEEFDVPYARVDRLSTGGG